MPHVRTTKAAIALCVLFLALLATTQPAQAQGRQSGEPGWSLRALLASLNPFVAATPGGSERLERVFAAEGPGLPPDGHKTVAPSARRIEQAVVREDRGRR